MGEAREETKTKICFFITQIGDPETEPRKRSDKVLSHIVKPLVEPEYKVIRADQISEQGVITTQVINQVIDADLVFADLSGLNPNVFYELAVRHLVRKPFVQIIRHDEKLPFDVAQMRTIQYDINDWDSLAQVKQELSEAIKKANTGKLTTPISQTFDLKKLQESGSPVERALAELTTEIKEASIRISSLESKISSSSSPSSQHLIFPPGPPWSAPKESPRFEWDPASQRYVYIMPSRVGPGIHTSSGMWSGATQKKKPGTADTESTDKLG